MRHLDWSRLVGSAGALLGGALLVLAAPAFAVAQESDTARPLELRGAGGEHTVDCEGRSVRIIGATNEITLNGECRTVEITGAANIVSIDAVARISVTGASNKVTWKRALNGTRPRVSVAGAGSSVTRAPRDREDDARDEASVGAAGSIAIEREREDAPRRADGRAGGVSVSRDGDLLRVLTSHGRDTIECDGRELTVVGSDNTLTLRGHCPLVRVTGSDNTVDAENVGRFLVTGSGNQLTWSRAARGAAPSVTNTGSDNVIRQSSRR